MNPKLLATPLLLGAALTLAACAGGSFGSYTLVRPQQVRVSDGAMIVTPGERWNRLPSSFYDISEEENWTLNGPILDSVTFIGGLRDGKDIVRQRRREDRLVPRFRANMTPPELVGMIESFYRIRGGSTQFTTTNLAPVNFLGAPGFRFDFDHLSTNEVKRRGRAYGAVIGNRLYLMLLDGARLHYFDRALPDFERMAQGARLRA